MKLFHKRDGTYGVTICRWNSFAIELWYSKPQNIIRSHWHNNIDSRIVHLFGRATFHKRFVWNGIDLPIFSFFKSFLIPAKISHGAYVGKLGLLFLNIERLTNGSKSSAAQDFHYVYTKYPNGDTRPA